MRVLSIDVGIKNLAYCLLEKNDPDGHFSIKCWDIANLSSPSQLKCCIKEKNKDCMQQAKFKITLPLTHWLRLLRLLLNCNTVISVVWWTRVLITAWRFIL